MHIDPGLKALHFRSGRHSEVFSKLNLLSILVLLEQALWHDGRRREDSGEGCSKKMSFFTLESWVAIEGCIEISRENVFDFARCHDVFWSAVWQLDPVVKRVVRHPVDQLVYTFATLLNHLGVWSLLSLIKRATDDPVILLSTENLSAESELLRSAHNSKSLKNCH